MVTIPRFQLYGDGGTFADPGFVHIETIATRSRLNDWDIRPHSHDTLDQLLFVRSGRARVTIEGRTDVLDGPAVIHVPASTVHGFQFDDRVAGDVLTFSIELRGTLAASQPASFLLSARPLVRALEPALLDRLDPLLAHLHAECAGHADGRIAASAWLVGLLLLQVGRVVGDDAGVQAGDARLATFRALVDRHYREHRPLAFYAEALGLTKRSLTRLAQARLGCAPMHYLHQRLLLEARRQLAYGSQSIARIAEELGFADASYFSRFYRRMTGKPPSTARGLPGSDAPGDLPTFAASHQPSTG